MTLLFQIIQILPHVIVNTNRYFSRAISCARVRHGFPLIINYLRAKKYIRVGHDFQCKWLFLFGFPKSNKNWIIGCVGIPRGLKGEFLGDIGLKKSLIFLCRIFSYSVVFRRNLSYYVVLHRISSYSVVFPCNCSYILNLSICSWSYQLRHRRARQ